MSRVVVAAVLVGGLALAGCEPGHDAAAPTRSPATAAATSSDGATAGAPGGAPRPGATATQQGASGRAACMKPYALGNLSRNVTAISGRRSAMAGQVEGVVVQAGWDQLEPGTPGRYDTSVLDRQIAVARQNGLTVRLRVTAGTSAPGYVKALGGAPIPFYDHQQRRTSTIGRFWRTDYQARWQALMSYLATRYDTDPTVREVNISGTGTVSSETMLTMGSDVIPGSRTTNGQRLLDAGATEAQRRAALMADIAFMQRTWAHTHTVLFSSPYVPLEAHPRTSLATTEQIIRQTYEADPGATVFGHTGAAESTFAGRTHPAVLAMYQFLIAQHYPFMAQTQSYGGGAKNLGVGDLGSVMTWLASHGAYSIELPAGWQTDRSALTVMSATNAAMDRSTTAAFAAYSPGC